MRKTGWKITVLIAIVFLGRSIAFSQGLSGWFDVIQSNSKTLEDGDTISETDKFNRNLHLNFQKSITPMLSYQLNLRTNFIDSDLTDSDGDVERTYRRSIEPGLDLMFGNPVYNLSTGYRRQENWDTAHLTNDGRITTEFYYSRFNVSPRALPSVNLQYDFQKDFDHIDDSEVDNSTESYSIGSAYDLPSRDLKFRYTVNYSKITNRTPLDVSTSKTINDNFNSSYIIGYNDNLWNRNVDYSVNYQGNYSRNKNRQFVLQLGSIVSERTPLGGLYAQDTTVPIDEDVDVLDSRGSLIDDDLDTSAGIGLSVLGSDEFQNIGIFVSSERPVDRLFIYVNKDITTEGNLNSTGNWRIFRSNFNQAGTWSAVPIARVTISVVDRADEVFRYEIEFSSPQNASFFKAVNRRVSTVADVFATEIEAYGTDLPDEDTLTTVSTIFTQGVNFNTRIRALTNLTFGLHYSLDRTDQNPISVDRSVGGFFENIFSDSVAGEKTNFRSDITRNYGGSATWLTHKYLTTAFRIQRNESFDNREETDVSSNTYNLSFNSVPLPTLDVTLTLIKNDNFDFDEKSSTSDSVILTVGSRLYRDVNMITDLGYIKSKSFVNDETTTIRQITGNIDAILTRELSGALNYGFHWTNTGDESSDSKDGSVIMTYRPGKFININGNLSASDSDGDLTVSEGIQIDWLPLPAVRVNTGYQHSDSDPGSVKTDTLSGYVIWYLTKFADVRFSYGYTVQDAETETETYNFITDLNCRF